MQHAAYNLITGEVLVTSRSNHLKRWVARTNRWDIAHGYGAGRWVFAHGANWRDKLASKLASY